MTQPTITARFPGTCQVCGRVFPVGTRVTLVERVDKRRSGWSHVDCQLGADQDHLPNPDAATYLRGGVAAVAFEPRTAFAPYPDAATREREYEARLAYVDHVVGEAWRGPATTVGPSELDESGAVVTTYVIGGLDGLDGLDGLGRSELMFSLARIGVKGVVEVSRPGERESSEDFMNRFIRSVARGEGRMIEPAQNDSSGFRVKVRLP